MSGSFEYHPLDVEITAKVYELLHMADFILALWAWWWGETVDLVRT
jgi:hypothetical protein